jgi:phage antirepressor YoqD-like protein
MEEKMKQIGTEKTMTVKEVAKALGVSYRFIAEKVKILFPDLVKNGIETKLNEFHVTEIKANIVKNPYLAQSCKAETRLERKRKIADAYRILLEDLEETEKELEAERLKNARLIHSGKLYTTTEIAKELGFNSAQDLNNLLESEKIQYKLNGTWVLSARYADSGYTSIKQGETESGHIYYDRKWTGLGRDFVINYIENARP